MIYTVDDLCLSYLPNFNILDNIKKHNPGFEIIAFTIADFNGNENLSKSREFREWYLERESWVEIAVHSFQHIIPDGDQDDEEGQIRQALDILKPFLPKEYIYRPAGWQTTNQTVPILKKLGFTLIAYETRINNIKVERTISRSIINSHLYDIKSLENINYIISRT